MKLARSMFEAALIGSKRFRRLVKNVVTLTTEFEKLVNYVHDMGVAVRRHELMLREADRAYGEIINEMNSEAPDMSLPQPEVDKKDLPN